MKKILSILCTLALVLSVVLIPGMFSASAAVTYLEEPTWMQNGISKQTINDKIAFGGTYGSSGSVTSWGERTMVFNYELEDNATYYIVFDIIGKKDYGTIRINAANKYDTAPTALGGSWLNIGSTSGDNGRLLANMSSTTFKRYGMAFDTADIVTEECKYLDISLLFNWTDTWISNIAITKAPANENGNIYPTRVQFLHPEKDGDNIIYNYTGWTDAPMFTFDYELSTDVTYKLTLDYFGDNTLGGMQNDATRNWKVSATDSAISYTHSATGSYFDSLMNKSNGNTWGTYSHVFTGAEAGVTATNKYLTLSAGYLIGNAKIRNIKIEVVESGSGSGGNASGDSGSSGGSSTPDDSGEGSGTTSPTNPEFSVAEPYMTPSYISGSTEIHPEANGDVGFGIYDFARTERSGVITFDYDLDPNKVYVIRMQIMGHGEWRVPIGIGVTSGKDKADISTATPCTTEGWGNDVTKIPLPKAQKSWAPAAFIFKGSDLINKGKTTFAMKFNSYYSSSTKPEDLQPSMAKNIIIEEFTGDGYIHPVKYGGKTLVSLDGADITYMNNYYDTCYMAYNVEVKPNTEYIVTFDIKGGNTGLGETDFGWSATAVADPYAVNFSNNSLPTTYTKLNVPNANRGVYISHAITVNGSDMGANATNKYFVLVKKGIEHHNYIKNVKIVEKPKPDEGSLLLNGTFENPSLGTEFWEDTNGIKDYVSGNAHTGNGAMHITTGDFDTISQKIDVAKNTTYEVSYWYKGKVGGQSTAVLTRDVLEVSRRYMFAQSVTPISVNEWKQAKFTFNSGDYTNVYLAFLAGPFSDYYLDDIKVATTSAVSEWQADKLINEPALTSFTDYSGVDHTLLNELTTYKLWTAAEGKNLFDLGDFENTNVAEYGDFISGSNGVLSIAEGEGYDPNASDKTGGNALKLSVVKQETNTTAWFYLDVEPYTDYFLTYADRLLPWSQENVGDVRVGIANSFTGEQYFVYREETRGHRVACNDNEWHRAVVPFNSGPNSRIAFSLTAANSTVYFDNVEIFKIADRVDDRTHIQVITDTASGKQPYVTDEAPTKIYVADSKNVVRNGDFDSDAYWKNAQGYKNSANGKYDDKYVSILEWDGIVEIKDTGTSRGNALYYKSQDNITGYPLGTTYIKYFDVEPNNEYTFVVDYVVSEYYRNPGILGYQATYSAADFGIAGATEIDMSVIKSVNIADAYNPNLIWQKLSISFNTNGYDRLAFFIRDNGGAAYFDNMSLFKTSDGSATPVEEEPEIVAGEIESNKYNVVGETGNKEIYGIVPGTTIKEVLDTLENKGNVKVYDAEGNEVKDTSKPVGNGYSFRYVDGFAAVDAAVALIRGDVNCDGYIDATDLKPIMRNIVNFAETLTDAQMVVADVDEDGILTANDLAMISMHIGGAKALEPIVVG